MTEKPQDGPLGPEDMDHEKLEAAIKVLRLDERALFLFEELASFQWADTHDGLAEGEEPERFEGRALYGMAAGVVIDLGTGSPKDRYLFPLRDLIAVAFQLYEQRVRPGQKEPDDAEAELLDSLERLADRFEATLGAVHSTRTDRRILKDARAAIAKAHEKT